MSSLTHEERIVSRCRDVFCNRCTMEWGAQTCGIGTAEFEGYYHQYIQRLCYSIQHKHEFFLCSELRFLALSGYMRPDETARRFLGSDSPENIEKVERWIESQGGINKNLSWRDVRLIRVKQGKQENSDGET